MQIIFVSSAYLARYDKMSESDIRSAPTNASICTVLTSPRARGPAHGHYSIVWVSRPWMHGRRWEASFDGVSL